MLVMARPVAGKALDNVALQPELTAVHWDS
jgi:hypothetical protein